MSTPSSHDSAEHSAPSVPSGESIPGFGEQVAAASAASGSLRRTAEGGIDVMHALGGVRGLLEAVLPSLVFLVAFLATADLALSLWLSVGLAVLAAGLRLIQRGRLMQAVAGLVGVLLCALTARVTGKAIDFYLVGLWTNAVYAVAVAVSMAVRWPLAGVLFGFLRGEETSWRRRPRRLRAYQIGTGVVLGVFLVRLLVEVPLFLAGSVAGLGIARLVLGLPFYGLGLWLGWMVTRPEAAEPVRTP